MTKDDFVPDVGTKFMKKGKIVDSMLNKKVESTKKVVNNMNFSAWKSAFGFGNRTTGEAKPDDIVDTILLVNRINGDALRVFLLYLRRSITVFFF